MVKNTIRSCSLVALSLVQFSADAQVELLNASDTIEVYLDELQLSELDHAKVSWGVKNEGSEPVSLMVTRHLLDTVSPFNYPFDWSNGGSYERFCWGEHCYIFGSDNSAPSESFLVTIDAGQTNLSFQSDFYPAGILGTSTLEYCFHGVSVLDEEVCHQLTFVVDASAGAVLPGGGSSQNMTLTPNPASSHVNIALDGLESGVLEFRNLVGQIFKTVPIQPGDNSKFIPLDDLPSGIWLVSHRIDHSMVITKRLVKH